MVFASDDARGVVASLIASFLFGLMYYYATLLRPLDGMAVFGWRVLFTLPMLTFFMCRAGLWPLVRDIVRRTLRHKVYFLLLPLSAVLLGSQFWLFLWAPINGKALEVSLGYLLMPLTMAICGRLVYKDHLQPFQKVAVVLAAMGVANQVYRVGGVSWEVLLVCLGYPAYFMLRRKLRTNHLGGLWFDMLLLSIPASVVVFLDPYGLGLFFQAPRMLLLLPLLGVMSTVSVGSYILASRFLSLSLFGLLSYIEPVLLVGVSLLLGERIHPQEVLTYVGVGLAVAVLALGGMRQVVVHAHRH